MQVAFGSEQGNAPRNEDRCLALQERGLFLVCDGLSVKKGGELAAELACQAFPDWLGRNLPLVEDVKKSPTKEKKKALETGLWEAFQEASRLIFQKAATEPDLHGMCTSVDLLLLLGNHALVGHVGAGRIFLVRQGEAHLLTEDHTQLAHLRRLGRLDKATPQQLASYGKRLTRAVGFQEEVKADFLWVELQPGDRFVMVTDGVWQCLGDATTSSLCARPGKAQELLGGLHKSVAETGARDNFSSLVLDPEPKPEPQETGADQKIKMLGKVPALEFLAYQDLLKVLSVADLVKAVAGQVLCKEGDPGGEMMLIISGRVAVVKNGQEIRSLDKGDVFGEMSMIDAARRSASVVASSPANFLAFPRAALFELFREDPVLSVKFLWGITLEMNKRLRMASNKLVGRPELEGVSSDRKGPFPFHRSL